jgi:hypothetical protein
MAAKKPFEATLRQMSWSSYSQVTKFPEIKNLRAKLAKWIKTAEEKNAKQRRGRAIL